jgi:hypothetical protein
LYHFTLEKHKKEFKQYTEELILQEKEIQERNESCNTLIMEYVNAIGGRPPEECLERLANYILKEHLVSKHPDKVTNERYPVLSARQQKTRNNKEFSKESEILDYIKLKKENKFHNLNKRNLTDNTKGE